MFRWYSRHDCWIHQSLHAKCRFLPAILVSKIHETTKNIGTIILVLNNLGFFTRSWCIFWDGYRERPVPDSIRISSHYRTKIICSCCLGSVHCLRRLWWDRSLQWADLLTRLSNPIIMSLKSPFYICRLTERYDGFKPDRLPCLSPKSWQLQHLKPQYEQLRFHKSICTTYVNESGMRWAIRRAYVDCFHRLRVQISVLYRLRPPPSRWRNIPPQWHSSFPETLRRLRQGMKTVRANEKHFASSCWDAKWTYYCCILGVLFNWCWRWRNVEIE